MTSWKTYRLGDIADIQTGPFGSQLHNNDYADEGSPIVTVEHLGNRTFTTQNLPLVSDKDKTRLGKYILSEGDIVFSRVGSVDRCSYVSKNEDGWLFSGRCLRVRCNEIAHPLFMYYYFCLNSTKQYVRNVAVGATMPSINTQIMSEIPISLPPLAEQRRIAGILGAIDDKIENNRRINTNLELQAQALYKQWFVDFEFPNEEGKPYKSSGGKMVDSDLGPIPEGWRVQTISDISVRIASGGTPKSLNESYYNGGIKWFTTKELKDCFLIDSDKHISTEALNDSAAKLFPKNTILMAIYAAPTVGRLGILTAESTFNQAAVGIVAKEEIGHLFVYLTLLAERENLNNLASGAAQQNLNVGIVKQYKLIVPTKKLLIEFNQIAGSLFERIKVVSNENKTLATLRDTLLPKLMNGEIKL